MKISRAWCEQAGKKEDGLDVGAGGVRSWHRWFAWFPVIAEPHTFEWALGKMKAGEKVCRDDWLPVGWVCFMLEGRIVEGVFGDPRPPRNSSAFAVEAVLATDWQLHEGEG